MSFSCLFVSLLFVVLWGFWCLVCFFVGFFVCCCWVLFPLYYALGVLWVWGFLCVVVLG